MCSSSNSYVSWEFKGNKFQGEMQPSEDFDGYLYSLTITNVKKRDLGEYYCYSDLDNLVTLDIGVLKLKSNIIFVHIIQIAYLII